MRPKKRAANNESSRTAEKDTLARQARAEYRRRINNAMTGLSAGVGTLLLFVGTNPRLAYITEEYFNLDPTLFPIVGVVLALMAMSTAVVQYLQVGTWGIQRRESPSARANNDHVPNPETTEPIQQEHAAQADTTRQALEPEDPHFADITAYANEMFTRLRDAIEEQGRRNNINLGFGIFITLLGIGALLYFVREYKEIDPSKPWSMLNFLPRLSLVVLIELFAYFFLNLYRNGLSEVKYLQNELVNVRLRTLALRTAVREGDKESAAYIMKAFADTDRNAVTAGKPDASKGSSEEVLKTAQEALKVAEKVASGGK
jgi:hypothetical protein